MDENIYDKLKANIPDEMWNQVRDELGKFTHEEISALIERIKLGNLTAAYSAIYAKLGPGENADAWDALNAKWQSINEQQWNRLQTAKAISFAILDAIAKVALVGVFL